MDSKTYGWFCVAFALISGGCGSVSMPVKEDDPDRDGPSFSVPSLDTPGPAPVPSPLPLIAAAPEPDLRLMTFNIRYGTAADGANSWVNRKAQVFNLIRAQASDVMGLQEALAFQIDEITANVAGYVKIGVGRDDGKTSGEFSPILYRSARFRVDTSGTFWLSDTPEVPGSKTWGNNYTRICTWARLVDRLSGRGFYFFNAHLDHESQPSREKSAVLIVQRMKAVKNPAEPVFFTGDFNVGEDNVVIQYFLGKKPLGGGNNPLPFLDSFRMLHPGDAEVGTFNGFTGATNGDKIDFVFVLPRITALTAEILRTHEGPVYPSDHFPVTASLTVPDWASTSLFRP
jgi:endonuclease/exonuclease/phosphatase family metal-dependent hydrolase